MSTDTESIIRLIITTEFAKDREKTDAQFLEIKNALSTGLDGKKGVIQRQDEMENRIGTLEDSDKARSKTVLTAVLAVAAAVGHSIWQLITATK